MTDFVVGGPDVHAMLAPDGRTLLTAGAIIRSNGATLPLERPGMELRGAALFGDSLAMVVYEPGTWRPHPGEGPDWVVTPAQKRRHNAFLLNTHSGQTLADFRYDGFWEELGFTFPFAYLPATHTGYLLDDRKGFYLVSESKPTEVIFRPLSSLTRFIPPARASEKEIRLFGYSRHYQLYIDTVDVNQIRCRYEQVAL